MKKKLFGIIGVLLLVTTTTGCTTLTFDNPFEDTNQSNNVSIVLEEKDILRDYINVAIPGRLLSSSPIKVSDTLTASQINLIGEGLYRQLPNGETIPGVIENTEILDDGRTIHFHIKEEAKWSNDQPVLAEDFELAWKALVLPGNDYYYRDILNGIVINATEISMGEIKLIDKLGVSAASERILEVNLESTFDAYDFLEELFAFPALYPIPAQFLKNNSSSYYGSSSETTLSNGPYKIENWNPGNRNWKYQKNVKYWNNEEYAIPVLNYQDQNIFEEAFSQLEQSNIDMLLGYVNSGEKQNYDNEFTLFFNNTNKGKKVSTPFDNDSVREIIFQAIDTNELIETIPYNAISGTSVFLTDQNHSNSSREELNLEYQNMLNQIGYEGIEVTLLIDENKLSRVLADELKIQIESTIDNFAINITSLPTHTFINNINNQNYDFAILNDKHWDKKMNFNYYSKFITDHSTNKNGYSNTQLDSILASYTFANALQEKDLNTVNNILYQSSVIKPLIVTSTGNYFNDALLNFEESTFNTRFDFRGASLTLEESN